MWSADVTGTFNMAKAVHHLWEFLQRIENAVGARIDGDRREVAPEDDALPVDDEQGTLANSFSFPISSIGACDLSLRVEVREQREVQMTVLGECLMTTSTIDRDAQELGSRLVELRKDLIIERHLVTADGTPVRWVKSQDHRPAGQVLKRQVLICRYPEGEIGSRGPGSQNLGRIASAMELIACVTPVTM
jgi:hypothetical protein